MTLNVISSHAPLESPSDQSEFSESTLQTALSTFSSSPTVLQDMYSSSDMLPRHLLNIYTSDPL